MHAAIGLLLASKKGGDSAGPSSPSHTPPSPISGGSHSMPLAPPSTPDQCISSFLSRTNVLDLEFDKVSNYLHLMLVLAISTEDWRRVSSIKGWVRFLALEAHFKDLVSSPSEVRLMASAAVSAEHARRIMGLPHPIASFDDDSAAVCRHVVAPSEGKGVNVIFSCNELFSSTFMSGNALVEAWRHHRCVLKTIGLLVDTSDHAAFYTSMADLCLNGSTLEHTVSLPTISLKMNTGTLVPCTVEARVTVVKTDDLHPSMFMMFKFSPDRTRRSHVSEV